jgi:hypothetical protein
VTGSSISAGNCSDRAVSKKIEGFSMCNEGADRRPGLLIPAANKRHLMCART